MKILALVNGHALAHVSRIVEICNEIKQTKDCRVIVAGGGRYLAFANKAGFETVPLPYVKEDIVKKVLVTKQYKELFPFEKVEDYLEADLALCREYQPDFIISDNRITARTAGDILNIPVYTIMNTHISPFMKTPYFDWASKKSPLPNFISSKCNWAQLKIELFYMDKLFFHGLKKIRSQRNLQTLKGFEHEQGHFTLIPDLPEFNSSRPLPSSALFIGPVVWQSNIGEPKFLKELEPDKITIFISLGSHSHQKLLERMEEFSKFPYQFIIATGSDDIELPEKLPTNVFVENFIDMDAVFPSCDVVICHGGNGTVYQALKHGLPVIGIPMHAEQNYNVQLVIKNKVGLGLPPGRSSEINLNKLMLMVSQVLIDRSYENNAEKFSKQMKEFDGPKLAANAILMSQKKNRVLEHVQEVALSFTLN